MREAKCLRRVSLVVLGFCGGLLAPAASGVSRNAPVTVAQLKQLELEDLLQQEVVLVSRQPEALNKAASAIQVISGNAIRRSGAAFLPEALRLASNLQVAQVDTNRWAVSARGFNSVLANKLLVMIDGRTVYSPLFAGVFWDVQDVMLDDVDRIEVVSGPGGVLWGGNAVNGVINVRTKTAADTQGWQISAGGGPGRGSLLNVRYGGRAGSNLHYRAYAKFAEDGSDLLKAWTKDEFDQRRAQGGFRLDWKPAEHTLLTFQGDIFDVALPTAGASAHSKGGNLQARFSRLLENGSEFQVQVYYDRSHRRVPLSFADRLETFDVELQHSFALGDRHQIVWGAGIRQMEDAFESGRVILLPPEKDLKRTNFFVQDTLPLFNDRTHLSLGVRVEDTDYTDLEFQPSARLAWQRTEQQTYWMAVSRAVRTPSRIDRERYFPGVSAGGPNFVSETLLAWEVGARMHLDNRLSVGLATFYHDYDRIRSIEDTPSGSPLPREISNRQQGYSYGAEATLDFQLAPWWQLHAGLTELRVKVKPKPGSVDRSYGALEAVDSDRYFSLRSVWSFPRGWEAWAHLRDVGTLTNRYSNVSSYTELDARLAWSPDPQWELSVSGRNLLHDEHYEYGDISQRIAVERSVMAMVRWAY